MSVYVARNSQQQASKTSAFELLETQKQVQDQVNIDRRVIGKWGK